jgi:hypothetical protein
MKVVAIVTGISKAQDVEFKEQDGTKSKHKCVSVWAKSAEEETQGKWITVFNLYDEKIADAAELGLAVNSMVTIDVKPNYHQGKDAVFYPSASTKLISIA